MYPKLKTSENILPRSSGDLLGKSVNIAVWQTVGSPSRNSVNETSDQGTYYYFQQRMGWRKLIQTIQPTITWPLITLDRLRFGGEWAGQHSLL